MRRNAGKTGLVIALSTVVGITVAVAVIVNRRRKVGYWRQKVVVITGGARGLGLEMARVWLARGARVAICARSQDAINRALAGLAQSADRVFGQTCDVTSVDQMSGFLREVSRRWGTIDCLVNNAGIMTVGPMDCMTESDFQAAMDTHFWAPLHTVQAALPHLKRPRGHIVNIASVGGQLSVPHMLPYSSSKFALVGLSEGLHAELAAAGVRVTTICPGMMRTGSPRNALFKGRHRDEYTWFSLGGSLPGLSISSRRAAQRIVNATTRGRAYLVLSLPAKLAIGIHGLFPGLASRMMAVINRMLPASGGIGTRAAPGAASASALSPSVLTGLTERAAARNNELS